VGEQYRSLSYSLWSFLNFPVTSSLVSPKIFSSKNFCITATKFHCSPTRD
jgi:hypothetical protein